MKAFLEEYAVIIIVAIIALIMVVLASPLGEFIGKAIAATVVDFVAKSGISNPPVWTSPF